MAQLDIMTLSSETLKQTLNQEINLHETPTGKGGLRGSSGRSDEWEKGFCQAMRHIRDSVLPPMERQEKTDPECWQNENSRSAAVPMRKAIDAAIDQSKSVNTAKTTDPIWDSRNQDYE